MNIDKDLLKKIKDHKKYRTINDAVVIREVNSYLKSNLHSGEKELIKDVRSKLHRLYSSYQTGKKNKRDEYLNKLKDNSDFITDLLSMTISTKERINDYESIYKNIFKVTGNPKVILDLGCGMNPLSFSLMNLETLSYYCYDIDQSDINFLNDYFKVMKNNGLTGKANILDVRDKIGIKKIHKSDIVFMFKLIDLLDTKENISENLIKILIKKTKFIVTSFPTRTLTRKLMKLSQRRGFEKMLERINLKFTSFNTDNEIFYIINKDNDMK